MTAALVLAASMAWGNRRRHGLAVVTLALGLIGLVTVAAASTTVARAVEYQATLRDGRSATVAVQLTSARSGDVLLARDRIRAILGSHAPASVIVDAPDAQVSQPMELLDARIVLTDAELISVRGWPVISGRWLEDADDVSATLVANVSAESRGARVGEALDVRGYGTAVVRGVIDDAREEPILYLRLDLAEGRPWVGSIANARMLVSTPGLDVAALRERLVTADQISMVTVVESVDRVDSLDALQQERDATAIVFLFVACFSVLALVVGIVNVSLATLRERALELALRRAMGLRRSTLATSMIIESQFVGVAASLTAVLASALVYPSLLERLTTLPGVQAAHYPVEAAVLAVAVGMLSCLIGSVVPVMRMWRMPMSVVMRQ